MKHILFGLNTNADRKYEEGILNIYKEEFQKEFTYDSEYYLSGIKRKLEETEKDFDILILREDLEGIANPVSIEYLDNITDKYPNLRIILIIEDEHEQDSYVKRIFNLGIYDVLYKEDAQLGEIVNLIENPRSKMKAKIYLDIDEIEDISTGDNLEEIPEEELERILLHLNQSTKETISDSFDEINRQYNDKQMLFLFTLLPEHIVKMLAETGNENFEKYHKRWLIIEGKYNEIQGKNSPGEKTAEGETKIITKIKKQYIHSIPKDYNKIVAFTGDRKVGTTTIVDLVAREFSKKGKKVVVLDLTENKTLFYMKCWGNEDITREEKNGLALLNKGIKHPIQVDDNYSLYTQIGEKLDKFDFFNVVEQIRYDTDIVLIDMDFNTKCEWLKYGVTSLYVVKDLNVLDIINTKNYLKKLIKQGVNSKKMQLIINKNIKSKVKPSDILNSITEPIPYLEFDSDDNYLEINSKIFTIDYEDDFYKELINSYVYVDERLKISDKIQSQIEEICLDIYPIESRRKKKGLFRNLLRFGK